MDGLRPERPIFRKVWLTLWAAFALGLLGFLGVEPAAGEEGVTSRAWSRFDRWVADFNPLGRHIKGPIEESLPGLTLRGSIKQWTDFNLHGPQTIGFVKKDWTVQMSQWLFEVELRYEVSPELELVNIYNFLYDAAYDWQSSEGLFADEVDRDARYYRNFDERILRELYLKYQTSQWLFTLGKQQVVWGKMDGQFIDIINPMDRRELLQLEVDEYEWRRIPTWMANVTRYFGPQSLQLMWIWDFEPDRLPVYGSPWWFPFLKQPPERDPALFSRGRTRKPPHQLGSHEWGVRYDLTVGGRASAGLIYAYLWNDLPTYFFSGLQEGSPVFRRRHTRVHQFGATLDYGFNVPRLPLVGELPVVFRFEGLLTRSSYFTDLRLTDPARGALALTGSRDDQVKRDAFRGAIAFEVALPGNTTLIFQPSLFYTFNWHKGLVGGYAGADRWELLPILYTAKLWGFTQERLFTSFTLTPLLGGSDNRWQGMNTRLVASYKFSPYITGRLIYTAYTGQRNRPEDIFGQYDQWDNLGWELSYEF